MKKILVFVSAKEEGGHFENMRGHFVGCLCERAKSRSSDIYRFPLLIIQIDWDVSKIPLTCINIPYRLTNIPQYK